MRKFISLISLVGAFACLSPITNAAQPKTQFSQFRIYANNKIVSSPYYLTANVYGHQTPFIPLFYIEAALNKLGVTTSWNGTTLTLSKPDGTGINLSNLPKKHPVSNSQVSFETFGKIIEYAPRIVAADPIDAVRTTYVPIYYLQQMLSRFSISLSWNGVDLKLISSSNQKGSGTVLPNQSG
ncbi:MAG: hypothetical protein K6T83_20150 [Alicyclobacillus sp.]|nr:hypothetical protein [Alicyclobacillus sp.]